jgi:hypothetical protein
MIQNHATNFNCRRQGQAQETDRALDPGLDIPADRVEAVAVGAPAVDSALDCGSIGGKVQERLACRCLGRNCNREAWFDRSYRPGHPLEYHSIDT